MKTLARLIVLCILPAAAYGHVSGLPIHVTGGAVDGGHTCAQCHSGGPGVNLGGGRMSIITSAYAPGITQTITVTVQDASMLRFGFQLTARLETDESKQAGSFSDRSDSHVFCDPDSSPGPCGGAAEYVTHTPDSTQASSSGTRTFIISWTPPGRRSDRVVLYASAVAANGDNLATGDHVYTASLRLGSVRCNLPGPSIIRSPAGITDAAGYRASISSNSLISVFGSGFNAPGANDYAVTKNDLENGQLPTDLACMSLVINGIRAPLFFTSANQINAQAPVLDVSGLVDAQVLLNPGTARERSSNVVKVLVSPTSPGLFSFNGQGTKSIAALNVSQDSRLLANPADVPGASVVSAHPGDIVRLYGTGFGATNPPYAAGVYATGPAPLVTPPVIRIGSVTLGPADVLYAGLSQDAPGLYQLDVRVPEAPDGNAAVIISEGSGRTQAGATIPIQH
jgi:uncharacterized protein (TIGR03437 family)